MKVRFGLKSGNRVRLRPLPAALFERVLITEPDMLVQLRLDAGQRTIGELAREREWAYREIVQLQSELAKRPSQPQVAIPLPPPPPGAPSDGLVKAIDVCRLLNVSRMTLHRLIKRGAFPPPLRWGTSTIRWRRADVLSWQASLGTSHMANAQLLQSASSRTDSRLVIPRQSDYDS
jgi:predicted DNA-binding transcriptional regulator AlpA